MKARSLLLLVLLLCAFLSEGQVTQKYFGSTGMSAFVNSSTLLKSSTNRIIVGAKKSSIGNDDAFISCVNASDIVLWTKEISTVNQDRFMSVVATVDGGCVAVGYVNQTIGSPYSGNQAAVYKFDASGTILWYKIFKASSYGEIFYSVVEDPVNNNIYCAGLFEFGLGTNNAGLIVSLDNSGTVNWSKRYFMPTGNQIMNIACHKNKIVCVGFYRGSTYYDGQIFAVKAADGSVIWNRSFEYNSNISSSNNTQWGDRLQIVNDTFYVDCYLSGTWGSAPVTPTLVRFDSLGMNALCLEYPITGYSYANVIHSKVVSSSEIYLFQHVGSAGWDRLQSTSPITDITDVVISKIRDIANPAASKVYTRGFSTNGAQAVICSEVISGKIMGWGASKNDPSALLGNQDIFKFTADTSLPVLPANCIADIAGQSFSNPIVSNNAVTFSSITTPTFITPATPTVSTVIYSTSNPCAAAPVNVIVPDFTYNRTACYTYEFKDLTTTTLTGIQYWDWDFGDGGSSTLQNPTHIYASSGSYTVKLIVTDSSGQKDSVSKLLTFVVNQFANAGNDTTVCIQVGNASVQLNASGGVSYVWSPISGLSDANIANPIASISSKSTYVVTVTDANGCIDKDTIIIDLKPGEAKVTATPKDISGCPGKEVQLNASGTKYYSWQPSTGLDNDKISNPKLTLMGINTYVVTGTDTNGCADRDTISVTTYPNPIVRATSDNNKVDCVVGSVLLSASGALNYEWSPGVFCETPNSATTQARPPATTVFTVKGSDANGCGGMDTITVFYTGETVVKVPNAFTPNNDGLNDKIKPIIACDFVLSEFTIYNRWGNRVYTTADVNKGWDGNYDGAECELGVYYYYIKGKNSKDEDILLKGDITLVR